MKQELIDAFIIRNGECFNTYQLMSIRQSLSEIYDERSAPVLGANFQKPTVILIIAILLGWDRFFLGEVGLGILKVLTCYGCGIWWLVDIFSAKKRTYKYNMLKLNEALMLCK